MIKLPRYFPLVLACFFLQQGAGQSQQVKDSLWSAWQNEKLTDSLRAQAVKTYIGDYLSGNPDETIKVSQELISFSEKKNDNESLAYAYSMISRGHYFKGEVEESLKNLKASIAYSKQANDIEQMLLSQLNMVSFFQEPYLMPKESLSILNKVDSVAAAHKLWSIAADAKYTAVVQTSSDGKYLTASKKLGELDVMLNNPNITVNHENGRLYYSVAYGYRQLEKYDKALAYYTKSIEERDTTATPIVNRYVYRAEVYLLLGDTVSAIQDFKKGYELPLKSSSDLYHKKERNYAGALYNYYNGDYNQANNLFGKVLAYNKETGSINSISYSYLYMARIAKKNANLSKFLSLSEEGLSYTKVDLNPEHRLEFLQNLYEAYKEQGNKSKALAYYEQYTALKDQLVNKAKIKALAIQEAENNFAIARQEADFEYEAQLQQERQQRNYVIGGGAVLLCMSYLGFLVYSYRKKRKTSEREQQLQEDYTQQLLQNTEDERSRIAGDLHDSVNHQLLNLKQKAISGATIQDQEITKVIEQVRSISHNLSPAMFDKVGLVKSIEELCRTIMEVNPLLISTQLNYNGSLSKKEELQIYRIAEEALNNIIKHSQATHAIVQISNQESYLDVSIKDNGIGLADDRMDKKKPSFGITNMIQRSKSINGSLDFISSNKGTKLNLKVQL